MTDDNLDRIATTIAQAPVGAYLGREGAEVLARYAGEERTIAPEEYLFRRGDFADTFYILTRGRLAVAHDQTSHRPERIVHVLEPGDMVGELSFIDGTAHTVSVRATDEEAAVLGFDVDGFNPLIEEHPRLMFDFMRAVVMRVHQTAASLAHEQQELTEYISRGGRRT